ncbi:MAG: hypothetical protein AB1700_08255 [Bacillota bacterium]
MVLEFGNIEQFIGEAKDAGVVRVYTTFLTEFPKTSGMPAYRAKFIVTAIGRVAAHAGEPEKTLLRYTRDFGSVLEDIASRKMPKDYARKVEQKGKEITEKLIGAGFQVRAGEITALT